jgi:CTP synthase (UTP-ammonia lyase)
MSNAVRVGIIGDFDNRPSHKATNEALCHCAEYLNLKIEIQWLPTEALEHDTEKNMRGFDAFCGAPGSPYKCFSGAINAIRYARENGYPFLGTCGGFQHAVIEYAKNVLGYTKAAHQEYDPDSSELFISSLSCSLAGATESIYLKKDSKVWSIYGSDKTDERYNCSFGLNEDWKEAIDKSGFKAVGFDSNGEVRILELQEKRFYIATLFQPQLSSTIEKPHKLILEYLSAANNFRAENN